SAPDPDVRGLSRPPAAQGLPQGEAAAARAPHRLMEPTRDPSSKAAPPRKLVLGMRAAEDFGDEALPTEPMTLNMGPSHPAMHATVRIVLTVDGEQVRDADVQVGYLHRCFEKESEAATYTQVFPYTDRLNYVSPMLNNVGYALAVEKLLGIERRIPE